MSTRSDVFELLDKGIDDAVIVEQLKLNPNTFVSYKQQWKKERGIKSNPPKTADELADKLFSDFNKKNEVKAETPSKKTYIPPTSCKEASKSTLKLLSESRTFKGAYGEYTITDGVLAVTLNDKSLLLEKPSLEELILELNQLGGMMQ